MAIHNQNSGSVYPDQSLLRDQIDPEGAREWFPSRPQASGIALTAVPTKTAKDLTRLDTLIINGETIYSPSSHIDKAERVFEAMETKLDSTSLALAASNLVQQDTGGEVLKQIALQKGICKIEKFDSEEVPISTHSVLEKKRLVMINTQRSDMSIIMESLVEQRDLDNPEDGLTYFKARTTLKGSQEDFENKNVDRLSIKAAYTAESDSAKKALQADYLGTLAGRQDPTSYLKA